MNIALAYFLLRTLQKPFSYSQEALIENAIRSHASKVQEKMAVLVGKNINVMDESPKNAWLSV